MEDNRIPKELPPLIQGLLRKRWLWVFLGFACFLIVVSAILNALTPPPPPTQTVVTTNKSFTAEISFDKNIELSMPNRFSVFKAQPPSNVDDLIKTFARELPLTPFPRLKNYWQDKNKEYGLSAEGDQKVIVYKKDILQILVKEGLPKSSSLSKEALTQKVQYFIDTHKLFENFSLTTLEPQLATVEGFESISDDSIANSYKLSVNLMIDGIPLISGGQTQPPAVVWIDKTGQILRVSFYPVPTNFEKVETYNSLGLGGVEQNMQKGIITYISASNFDAIEPEAQNLTAVNFTQATLEYRQHQQNGYILPYIHFVGTGKDKAGKLFNIEAISPAVKVE